MTNQIILNNSYPNRLGDCTCRLYRSRKHKLRNAGRKVSCEKAVCPAEFEKLLQTASLGFPDPASTPLLFGIGICTESERDINNNAAICHNVVFAGVPCVPSQNLTWTARAIVRCATRVKWSAFSIMYYRSPVYVTDHPSSYQAHSSSAHQADALA